MNVGGLSLTSLTTILRLVVSYIKVIEQLLAMNMD